MRSIDDDNIYVVGECAQHRGQVYGLVAPLWEQAGVLADHLTGTDRTAAYHGSRTATKLKVAGVDVAAMGLKAPELPDDEFVQYSEPRHGVYKTIVIRDGKLVGATLVGDVSKVSFLTQAFDSGLPLPDERVSLMFDIGTPDVAVGVAELSDDAQVCNCNGVNKGTLVSCVQGGETSVSGVMAKTKAGKGCGSCKELVGQIVEWAAGGAVTEDPSASWYVPGNPVRQADVDAPHPRARIAFGVIGVRRAGAGRPGGRQLEDGTGVAAGDDVGRRVRRRTGRAVHQRPGTRQHPTRRHVLGGAADEGRRDQRRGSCAGSPTWPRSTTSR